MKKALLVLPNGFNFIMGCPDDDILDWARKLIDCDWVEIVRPKRLAKGLVLLVDEEGLLKERPSVNVFASTMYETEIHGSPIVGNVIVLAEVMGDEGPELAGIDAEVAKEIADAIRDHVDEWAETIKDRLSL